MVVDIIDIGIRWWCFWSHILIVFTIMKKHTVEVCFFILVLGTACTNRAENKQDFTDLMQRVKEFREKWLISPMGEN